MNELLAASVDRSEGLVLGEIGFVLIVLGTVAFVTSKLRISVVPFSLLSGLVLGTGGVLRLELSDNFLSIGAQIGAILLLLLMGLEYSAKELLTGFREQRTLGLCDFLVNFIPGSLCALILGWGWTGALALGGISYVSSSGIAMQFIRESRWQRLTSTRHAINILVMEDLVLAPLLPILSAFGSGVGLLTGFISISVALIVTGVAIIYSARGGHIPYAPIILGDSATLLLVVFGSALLASGVATYIGFSGAVAAFLVGLLMTDDLAIVARVRLAPLRDLFSAIFFLFFGLRIDPAKVPSVLLPALVLTAIGIGTKFLTAWWATRKAQEPGIRLRVTGLLVPRGEFSLVIAGLTASTFFGEKIQLITITFVILTTFVGSILVRISSAETTKNAGY
ncbi:MAG: cation:proton antiporter [Candidatus Nanopelagicaceae bacterium]|nr:cation:proton antiporter [Candidatus Nanopelagicaceae bacterium]